jgi:hypothetical protein
MPPPCGIIPRLLLAWICTKAFRNRPDIRRLVGGCAAAICRLQAATAPEPGDAVVGLGVDQVNRRFAAACAAAGLEGRRTSHGGRVVPAVELTARGAATHAVQLLRSTCRRESG